METSGSMKVLAKSWECFEQSLLHTFTLFLSQVPRLSQVQRVRLDISRKLIAKQITSETLVKVYHVLFYFIEFVIRWVEGV